MKRPIFASLIALLMLSWLSARLNAQVLPLPQVIQEESQWCWAAVSKAVLAYHGHDYSQCDLAEYTRQVATWHHFGEVHCCTDASQGCNYWNYNWGTAGSIEDILYDFGRLRTANLGQALPLNMAMAEIVMGRPFIFRWGWTGGGGHFLVGHGFSGMTMHYMDPWPGRGHMMADFNWVRGSDTFSWTHTQAVAPDCPDYERFIVPMEEWQTHSGSHIAFGQVMYRVAVTQGQEFTFKTGCDDGATASYDTMLHLYDTDCQLITSDDDGCENGRSQIQWTATYTGYAYLEVSGYGNSGGHYTLAYRSSGETEVPSITLDPHILAAFGEVAMGEASNPLSYTVSWYSLEDDIHISSGHEDFRISFDPHQGFEPELFIPISAGDSKLQGGESQTIPTWAEPLQETYEKTQALHFFEQQEAVRRFGRVVLNDKLRSPQAVDLKDLLTVELFDRGSLPARVRHVDENLNGSVTVLAADEGENVWVTLVSTGNRSLGSIYIPAEDLFYQLISDPVSLEHYLIEMRASDLDVLEGSPPLIPPVTDQDAAERERVKAWLEKAGKNPNDPAEIDVMIVYSPAARQWADNHGGGIENVVAASMAHAYLALANSQTRATMRLVHAAQVGYVESGNSSADLIRFTASRDFNPWGNTHNGYQIPGYMNEIHDLRDAYGADLSALFVHVQDTGGLGWLLSNPDGSPNFGFSLTRIQQAATSYTHIHEMGHNMGCHHHKDQNFQAGPGLFSYSAGWRWVGNEGGRWVTLMSYSAGSYYSDGITHTSIPYFSNPNVFFEGVAIGHALHGDNARTIREVKHAIAAYRPTAIGDRRVVWVRFAPSAIGWHEGDIRHASAGADPQNLRVAARGFSDGTTCFPPRDLQAGLLDDQRIRLSWQPPLSKASGPYAVASVSGKALPGGLPGNTSNAPAGRATIAAPPLLFEKAPITGENSLEATSTNQTGKAVVLHYDGDYGQRWGLTDGGNMYAAACFRPDMLSPYEGYLIHDVDVYISDQASETRLFIWGSAEGSGPGQPQFEQAFSPEANAWNRVHLEEAFLLTGDDVCVGYMARHEKEKYPVGSDDGPNQLDGDWYSSNGTNWNRLVQVNSDYSVNWNIRARLLAEAGNLIGYNLYLNGDLLITLEEDVNEYTDGPRDPGTYAYTLTTLYEGCESAPAGPVEVFIAPDKHYITATAGPGGRIEPSGEVEVARGDDQVFDIIPGNHHHLAFIKVDDREVDPETDQGWNADTSQYSFREVTQDHRIEVGFATDTYIITATTGSDGRIEPLGEVEVVHGDDQRFILTPDGGFRLAFVRVDGNNIDLSGDANWEASARQYTFVEVMGVHSIEAGFEQDDTAVREWLLDDLQLYPNPATGELYVEFNHPAQGQSLLRVYNLQGQMMLQKTVESAGRQKRRLDTSALPPGMYLLRMTGPQAYPVQAFMVR